MLEIPFTATDVDGNPIRFTLSGLPEFATYVQGSGSVGADGRTTSGGVIRFASGDGHRGDYAIIITAQDDGGTGAEQSNRLPPNLPACPPCFHLCCTTASGPGLRRATSTN